MPEMDGYEATIRIRNLDDTSLQKIPIIAMTANVMQGDRERCLSVGMNEYVSKPLVQKDLERVFAKLFPYAESDNSNAAIKDKNPQSFDDKSVRQAFYNIRITHGIEMTIEVIELFLDGTPEAIAKIESACRANQYEKTLIEVHGLKSSGYLFGLQDFANHAQLIESDCKNKNYVGLDHKIEQLRQLFDAAKPLLELELTELRKRSP